MKDPAYNLIEIATLLEWAIQDASLLTFDYLSDVVTEDMELYAIEERELIADLIADTMNKLKEKLT